MNILLAVVVMAVVLAQGAEVPIYQDQPPVVGAVTPGRRRQKRRHSSRRSHPDRRGRERGDLGGFVHRRRHTRQPRRLGRATCATVRRNW